jgi:hypothetical protein
MTVTPDVELVIKNGIIVKPVQESELTHQLVTVQPDIIKTI